MQDVFGGPNGALAQLQDLVRVFERQTAYRFFSTSVLITYEGAAASASEAAVRLRLVDFAHVFRSDAHTAAAGAADGGEPSGSSGGISSSSSSSIATSSISSTSHGAGQGSIGVSTGGACAGSSAGAQAGGCAASCAPGADINFLAGLRSLVSTLQALVGPAVEGMPPQ